MNGHIQITSQPSNRSIRLLFKIKCISIILEKYTYGIKTNELISDPKQIKNTKILKHEEKFYFYFLS